MGKTRVNMLCWMADWGDGAGPRSEENGQVVKYVHNRPCSVFIST